MARISAAQWWRALADLVPTIRDHVTNAQRAERRERGHDCGHQFTIQVTGRFHTYGSSVDPAVPHRDSDWDGEPLTLTVRAHNQRDALLLAACTPLSAWAGWDGPEESEAE